MQKKKAFENMKKETVSKLSVSASMLIFGTIGLFRRLLPLPSGFIACARGFIGALFLLVICIVRGKKLSEAVRRRLPALCVTGGMIGANWILLFEAYNYTSVAAATLCYYLAPMLVILVSPFLFREKLTLKKGICALCAFVGITLVSGIFRLGDAAKTTGNGNMLGLLLGCGAAVLYAAVIIGNKKIADVPAFDRTLVQLAAAAIVVLPYTLFAECKGDALAPVSDTKTVIILLLVGILHTGIAYSLYFGAFEGLSAQSAAILSYIDPVSAILLSALFLSEPLDVFGIIGAVLVLGAALISELPEKSRNGMKKDE